MSAGIEAQGRAAGERAAARWRTRVADHLRGIGGIGVETRSDGVAVSGRRLTARWLTDARLRWIGGWS